MDHSVSHFQGQECTLLDDREKSLARILDRILQGYAAYMVGGV